jgi:molybdate transport system ATP-binding protein
VSGFAVRVDLERRSSTGRPFRLRASLVSDAGVTVLFGPSGAGKSTLLQTILGSLRPGAGRIEVAGRVVFDSEAGLSLPIHRRRVGIVFQDALLFPHLDARRNVAFGMGGSDVYARAQEFLDRVGAGHLGARMPDELSGGERQRVALARTLAAGPDAVLLDEPFSALDAGARRGLGEMVLDLQRESGVPFLHVTHDIGEALRLGDRMVVLDDGAVVQSGSPAEVVSSPTAAAAARAVGTENLFSATVQRHFPDDGYTEVDLGGTVVQVRPVQASPGKRVVLALHAEDVLVSLRPVRETSARNVIAGTIESVERRGTALDVRVRTPVPIRALVTPASVRDLGLVEGKDVFLLVKVSAFRRRL